MHPKRLNLTADSCSVASIDIENMHPSIKFKRIKQVIQHYSQDFNEEEDGVINAALEMLKFSMGNTLLTFCENYYEYGVDDNPMNRSLTIGGYNTAWNFYLIARYLLDLVQEHFLR